MLSLGATRWQPRAHLTGKHMGAFSLPNPSYSGASNVPAKTPRKDGPVARMQRYRRNWQYRAIEDATHFITANVPPEILEGLKEKKEPVSQYVTKLMKAIVRCIRVRSPKYQADYIWVLEAKNGIHVHIAIRIPEGVAIKAVESLLAQKFGVGTSSRSKGFPDLYRDNSKLPVHIATVSPERRYQVTGSAGFKGLLDYLSKSLDCNSRRRKGSNLGKIVGASQSVM